MVGFGNGCETARFQNLFSIHLRWQLACSQVTGTWCCPGGTQGGSDCDELGSETRSLAPRCLSRQWQQWTQERKGRNSQRLAATLNFLVSQSHSVQWPTNKFSPLAEGITGTMKLLLKTQSKGLIFWLSQCCQVRKPVIKALSLPGRDVKFFLHLRSWDTVGWAPSQLTNK